MRGHGPEELASIGVVGYQSVHMTRFRLLDFYGESAVAKRVDNSDVAQHDGEVAIARIENAAVIASKNPTPSNSSTGAGSQDKESTPHSPSILPLPSWLKRPIGRASQVSMVQQIVKARQIHTICEEGRCPNRAECYGNRTATFLLMGPVCTRACAFCQVATGRALPLDPLEPEKVAESVVLLGLRYVVLTAVARDDLADGGAGQFVATIAAIRRQLPGAEVEVLTPDFWGSGGIQGQRNRIAQVVAAKPACFNHNVETVRRLQKPVRRGASYERSLQVLEMVKDLDSSVPTKSGLMLGHGETETEIIEALRDLRTIGCDRLTLGQYMQPSLAHLPVQRYWTPGEFDWLGAIAKDMGFSHVRSGPLVRSSYHAGEAK